MKHTAESAGEAFLDDGEVAVRCERLRNGAGGGHLSEDFRLVGCVPLDGIHQVRDEVVTPLALDVDLPPGLLHEVACPDEAVVAGESLDDEADDDDGQDDERDDHGQAPV